MPITCKLHYIFIVYQYWATALIGIMWCGQLIRFPHYNVILYFREKRKIIFVRHFWLRRLLLTFWRSQKSDAHYVDKSLSTWSRFLPMFWRRCATILLSIKNKFLAVYSRVYYVRWLLRIMKCFSTLPARL